MALIESYARILDDSPSGCFAGCCTTKAANSLKIAKKIGYHERELEEVPSGSNLGLGCGNPVAFASLEKGDVVLDLGSGAGLDSFIASRIVGPKGLIIGVDMTAQMIKKAKENALEHLRRGGPDNLDFGVGEIESLEAGLPGGIQGPEAGRKADGLGHSPQFQTSGFCPAIHQGPCGMRSPVIQQGAIP